MTVLFNAKKDFKFAKPRTSLFKTTQVIRIPNMIV
jgi:hypothetical protein